MPDSDSGSHRDASNGAKPASTRDGDGDVHSESSESGPAPVVSEWVAAIGNEWRCSARELGSLFSERVEDAEIVVDGKQLLIQREGETVAGLSIEDDQVQIQCPNGPAREALCSSSQPASESEGWVRFEQLSDIRRSGLRALIESLNESPANDQEEC